MNKFEVYICLYSGKVVYVGYGAIGRHKHCISGTSHNYRLNKLHFTVDPALITVQVLQYCKTKDEAKRIESELISKYNPVCNVQETAMARNKAQSQSWLDEITQVNNIVVDK